MKKTAILILVIPFIISCNKSQRHMVTLWTNRPEIAAYVEEYNATHDNIKIEIEYKEFPGRELAESESSVDLVFDEYLNSGKTVSLFSTLDSLFEKGELDSSVFYSSLLDRGKFEDRQVLLPVSFNLPVVYFKKGIEPEYIVPFFMNLDTLKNASGSFNEKSKRSFRQEGFSPLWSRESIFQISVLQGSDYKQLGSILSWNDEKIEKSTLFIKNWIEEVNGGLKEETEFKEKFLYDPMPKLINQGRIGFAYTDINAFFALPPEKRKNLDFRWFSSDNKVYALNTILYAGIPKNAAHRKDARIFLTWFYRTDTQKKLLEASLHKRIRIFGIGQGFSSLKNVNSNELPRLYPALMGHIPPENAIIFPDPVPGSWPVIKEQIIKPWLYNKAVMDDPPNKYLKDEIMEWERQNPEQNKVID